MGATIFRLNWLMPAKATMCGLAGKGIATFFYSNKTRGTGIDFRSIAGRFGVICKSLNAGANSCAMYRAGFRNAKRRVGPSIPAVLFPWVSYDAKTRLLCGSAKARKSVAAIGRYYANPLFAGVLRRWRFVYSRAPRAARVMCLVLLRFRLL